VIDLVTLLESSEYTYRVGDGNYWSDVNTFTLKKDNTDANLFIIGDAQSEDTTNVDKIIENLMSSGIDFNAGIQTGDLVDSGKVYTNWTSALDIFAKNKKLSSTEILHAIGNHEREGDSELTASQSIFNMPNVNHYSVEYGNVYVATLSYAFSEAQLKADLEWLIEDAAKSDALWKVVVTHQPAYYTNTAGSNELMHELLPAAAEKAGIDFVFSGHDHAYARTEPLTAGKVDEENVIVYYICGSTGEKSYSITDNKDFHFAQLNDDFEAIYMTVNATDKQFTVKTYELDGSVIDEYVKDNTSVCMTDGHSYTYTNSDYLECAECHYERPVTGYTGFVSDEGLLHDSLPDRVL
jgi:Icc-related predicted phosphoesterase